MHFSTAIEINAPANGAKNIKEDIGSNCQYGVDAKRLSAGSILDLSFSWIEAIWMMSSL